MEADNLIAFRWYSPITLQDKKASLVVAFLVQRVLHYNITLRPIYK